MNADAETAAPLQAQGLTKDYGATRALAAVRWEPPAGSSTGLIGTNGAGKTTLLQIAAGLVVPTGGTCHTLGVRAHELGAGELARIGYVDQAAELLDWLTVEQHVRYVASFQPRWDRALERDLRQRLELTDNKRVGSLSKGMQQRLALLLAVCHRPRLLLLDEPVSALDPLARIEALELILERVVEDGTTVVISSHGLFDVEKIVDRVLCLDRGRVVADAALDDLKESYAEWVVTARDKDLPREFPESFVLVREGEGRRARLAVRAGERERQEFARRYGAAIESKHLDLEHIFPLLVAERRP